MRIGIAVDNTVPLHLPTFSTFIRSRTDSITCTPLNTSFRVHASPIEYETEVKNLGKPILEEVGHYDLVLLVTAIPFANNYFYEGTGKFIIVSFSGWHQLTNLSMSNGLAYMICQIIIRDEMKIGDVHDQNTGCINDFLWDKAGIDVSMRAAFICGQCKEQSTGNIWWKSKELAGVESILNAVSAASRGGTDVLLTAENSLVLEPIAPEFSFDVFLCHNSQDKHTVRKLNEALKAAGVRTWLDEEQIPPSAVWQDVLEKSISRIAGCLVIVGDSGIGPWQDFERRALINEFASRGCKVIPVLIGSPATPPQLPLFLRQFMWVDLRNNDPVQIARLIAAVRAS